MTPIAVSWFEQFTPDLLGSKIFPPLLLRHFDRSVRQEWHSPIPAITVIQSNSVYYILCHVLSLFSGGVCGRRLTPRTLHAMETGNKHRPCGPLTRVRLCLTLSLISLFVGVVLNLGGWLRSQTVRNSCHCFGIVLNSQPSYLCYCCHCHQVSKPGLFWTQLP